MAHFMIKTLLVVLILGFGDTTISAENSAETKLPESNVSYQINLTLSQSVELALRANRGVITAANAVQFSEQSLKAAESEFEVKFVPAVDAFQLAGGGDSVGCIPIDSA